MSKITIDNYEAFVLDYMEGNLDEIGIRELMAFVINHPELDLDLEDLDLPKINEEKVEFDFKSQLKKSEPSVSDETLFDYLEQNLAEDECKVIEFNLLNNKLLSLEYHLLKQTILVPDSNEVFFNKAGLYKSEDDLILRNRVLVYYEGQLSLDEQTDFKAELKTSKLLQNELSLYSKTKLSTENQIIYPDKEELKMWTLAYFEGLLSGHEKRSFETALKTSSGLKSELASYAKTKLLADQAVVYPAKSDLKKGARVISLFGYRSVMAVAAAILLLVGFFVVFNYYNSVSLEGKPDLAMVVKHTHPLATKKEPLANKPSAALKNKTVSSAQNSSFNEVSKQLPPAKGGSPLPSIQNRTKQTPAIVEELKIEQEVQVPGTEKVKHEELIALGQKNVTQDNNQPGDTFPVAADLSDKYTVLLASEDIDDDNSASSETGFWSRAVKLAKRANKMGVKSIDVNETSRKKFSLSFNSFSVEKH